MWVLATQPATPRTSAEQNLTLSFGRNGTLVGYEAALSIDGGYLFQLGVQVPPNLVVERISAVDADVERVARWSLDPSGQITIFLTGPITGRQKLVLRGRIDAPPSGAVPQLALTGATIARNRWRLHRQSAVLVQVEPVEGVTRVEAPAADWSDDFGALVGCYESTDARENPTIKVTANVPHANVVVATGMLRDNDRWMAELFCNVKVAAGAVDALEFDIPPQWVEPFRFDPPLRPSWFPFPARRVVN